MKRKFGFIISLILFILIGISITWKYSNIDVYGKDIINAEELKEKLIRFHVIANSDSDEDQNLKLKVRDEIIKYIQPKLKDSNSIDESREILLKEDSNIKKIAEKTILDNGYNYKVESNLGLANFPVKNYGNITLPQGQYEAYRIIIGNGEGQNWWCVMFPPLCFIDVTSGQVAVNETEEKMKEVLTDEEYSKINNIKEQDYEKTNKANNKEEDINNSTNSNGKNNTKKHSVEDKNKDSKVNFTDEKIQSNNKNKKNIIEKEINKEEYVSKDKKEKVKLKFKLGEIFQEIIGK